MDIRELSAESLRLITIENFEKNNSQLLDVLSKQVENAVDKGSNIVSTDSLFFGKSSPKGLQNYLIHKGFKTTTSCNGNLSSFSW